MPFLHRTWHWIHQLIHRIMDNHPLTNYHFTVEWGSNHFGFYEVTGLCIENEVIEYREGSNPEHSTTKMPGKRKYSNLVLKRGVIKNNFEFYHWMKTINGNMVEKRDVVIKLLNEAHEPVMAWRARNAWPCKLLAPELKASSNEVAVETIELAHEGLEVIE